MNNVKCEEKFQLELIQLYIGLDIVGFNIMVQMHSQDIYINFNIILCNYNVMLDIIEFSTLEISFIYSVLQFINTNS